MKLNNKAFTLIELLAMLVVLGILMAITVPNITGILNQHKTNVIIEDVNKMVETAKVKIASNSNIKNPDIGKCLVFSLNYLDDNQDIETGPNGGAYNKNDSFVIVTREGSSYKYYVRLVEENDDEYYGVNFTEYSSFEKNSDGKIDTISSLIGITREDSTTQLESRFSTNSSISVCKTTGSIINYYS